ncbi:MAG TPA: hypothetical protein ENN91_05935, partial [Firmicutes bacterium]|nr:hypothetical protein [Bacillota bacterium]
MQNSPILIKDLPSEERPREKLKMLGAEALSNAELLAILLRTGHRSESAVQLATRILAGGGGLRRLPDLTLEDLQEFKGIGPDKAVTIKAALELGCRIAAAPREANGAVNSPRQAAAVFMEELRY